MAAKYTFLLFLLVLAIRSVRSEAPQQRIYNVLDFHAAGDGKKDDTQAFLATWVAACNDNSQPIMIIPGGRTFLLSQVRFSGNCMSPIKIQLDGNIVAPNSIWTSEEANLITFYRVNSLTLDGNGQIDGRGDIWWTCYTQKRCVTRPIVSTHNTSLSQPETSDLDTVLYVLLMLVYVYQLLAFDECNNLWVMRVHLKNSPIKHMVLYRCSQVHVYSVSITAPGDSPNTDGITMASSDHVYISKCSIKTGDDCISMLSYTTDVNITDSICGPGHGISVGSLGEFEIALVERILVSNCNFFGTTNGVRIKTWQGGKGQATGFIFENLNMTAVQYPIVIDQFYCPQGNCTVKYGGVAIRDAKFINIHGTSSEQEAIKLLCSQSVPCESIYLSDIDLSWANHPTPANATVLNAQGTIVGTVIPKVQFSQY
ncbi:hypothetical protein ABZP36_015780 [Zizania latifolia]